ncbi:MAG: ParB-like nuclease domain-containing protein [Patescibacteria group bacterium]|nr:ParB-like nuclease domain-containing protein [Patescibacteria group bacterium]
MSIKKVKLSELKETFVVRIELNREHVEHLRDLIDTGVELEPLLVSFDDMELIDGRHRKAAYTELGITEVPCKFKKFDSNGDKIVAALQANVGGSLPPTPADINHTMQIMLLAGETRKSIIEKVSGVVGFPKKLVQNHLDRVQSDMVKARLRKAVNAVTTEGKTVPEAASEFGVKLETLQRNIAGKVDDGSTNAQQLKSHLSKEYGKLTLICGHNLSKMIRDLKDGVITVSESEDVIRHLKKLTDRFNHYHSEWLKRFGTHLGTVEKAERASVNHARKAQVSLGKRALGRMGL